MQTAMQQLINEVVEHLTYDDDLTEDSRIALETIRLRCLGKLEMEKQQMFDYIKKNYVNGEHSLKFHKEEFEQYYNETYGSKGSDDHIVDTNEMIQDKEKIKTAKDNSKIGIRWKEYQDWLNEVPEISDQEIEARVKEVGAMGEYYKMGYRDAIKWYREQLKNK